MEEEYKKQRRCKWKVQIKEVKDLSGRNLRKHLKKNESKEAYMVGKVKDRDCKFRRSIRKTMVVLLHENSTKWEIDSRWKV